MENKHQGLGFTKYVLTSVLTLSTSRIAVTTSFVKATYTKKVKISPTNAVTKGKMKVLSNKTITAPKVRVLAPNGQLLEMITIQTCVHINLCQHVTIVIYSETLLLNVSMFIILSPIDYKNKTYMDISLYEN